MLPEVNEDTTAYLTVTFLDKTGAQQAPSSLSYRIDCLTNGQEVKGDTSLTPGASVEITLSATDNALISQANGVETRVVTVEASYGAGDGLKAEYKYNVRNLKNVA